jgi:hypothetical protein
MDNTDLKAELHMVTLGYWLRLIRLPFVISFALAAYLTLINIAKGWKHSFFIWMLWPFMVATIILEYLQLSTISRRKKHIQVKQTQQKEKTLLELVFELKYELENNPEFRKFWETLFREKG